MKMHSIGGTNFNIESLFQLFPNCVVEALDDRGKLSKKIDFELLKQELSSVIVEESVERYQISWPGKKAALLAANSNISKTLRPVESESVNFKSTQNLYIEGDNLDVLKLLQESYLEKIKMIYIDPPYNTGNDFLYRDDFSESSLKYKEKTSQVDEEGIRLVANTESNGRFHSDWLSMIYPRLKLARNMLRNDGVIFVSIDDGEVDNLKKVMCEIFGEKNFIGTFTVVSTPNARDYGHIGKMHEYVHFFAKDIEAAKTNQLAVEDKNFRFADEKGGFNIHPLYNSNEAFTPANRPNLYFPIYAYPDKPINENFFQIGFEKTDTAIEIFPPKSERNQVQFVWRWGKPKCVENFNAEIIGYKTDSGVWRIVQKMRHTTKIIRSLLDGSSVSSRRGTAEVEELLGGKIASFPKPLSLIKTFIEAGTDEEDIVLDFFSGSGTTAQAVLDINSRDNGRRKFICVQLPELCDTASDAFKAGYKNIADIGKERIRRAGLKLKESSYITSPDLDVGFRVLKVDSSNMTDLYYSPDAISQDLLSEQEDNVRDDRTSEDLLFQVLLDWGVDLSLSISSETIQGKQVFFVDDNALVACFDKQGGIDEDFVKELAKRQPLRVVFRDAGFKSDSVKINVEQIFKLLSPSTEVKCI